jgi:EpsI family protein
MPVSRYRLLLANLVLLFMLVGGSWGRSFDDFELGRPDLLSSLSLPFKDWRAEDTVLSESDLNLLEPDAYLVRRYSAPDGRYAELAVIAGHKKRSVHNPGFCMVGGGWEMLSQSNSEMKVRGATIPITRATISKEGNNLQATYFYTDGEFSTNSPLAFSWAQLTRRFRSQAPIGAMVRIIVPLEEEEAASIRLAESLAQATLPQVLQALQDARATANH